LDLPRKQGYDPDRQQILKSFFTFPFSPGDRQMTSFLAAMILLGPATEPEPKFTMEAQKEIKKLEG
jgi:hypothetical protein